MSAVTCCKRIASTADADVVVLAQEDPLLVKEVIAQLRASGEIAADDLVYLDRIADRWIGIADGLRRGTGPACTT
jgi:hypothetical protein